MEFLGIGPSELAFIVIIALIVLGPKDMQKAGRTLGKWLRKLVTSDGWKLFQQTSREIQTLPNRLMREAALDDLKNLQNDLKQPLQATRVPSEPPPSGTPQPTEASRSTPDPISESTNKILPPTLGASAPASDEDKNA